MQNEHSDHTADETTVTEQEAGSSAERVKKAPTAFRTISEVADELLVPQHVLRFWETRFSEVRPLKRAGGRRYYRPDDVVLLRRIAHLLYVEGYTIKGVQRVLREGVDPSEDSANGVDLSADNPTADGVDDLFAERHEQVASIPTVAVSTENSIEDGAQVEEAPTTFDNHAELSEHSSNADEHHSDLGDSSANLEVEEQATAVASPTDEFPPSSALVAEDEPIVEHNRIVRENALLRESLQGILVELEALRQLIPV